jgi:hypothetical protein
LWERIVFEERRLLPLLEGTKVEVVRWTSIDGPDHLLAIPSSSLDLFLARIEEIVANRLYCQSG